MPLPIVSLCTPLLTSYPRVTVTSYLFTIPVDFLRWNLMVTSSPDNFFLVSRADHGDVPTLTEL